MFLTANTYRQASWAPDQTAGNSVGAQSVWNCNGGQFGSTDSPATTTMGPITTYSQGSSVPWEVIGQTAFPVSTVTGTVRLSQTLILTSVTSQSCTTISYVGTTALGGNPSVSTVGQISSITSVSGVGLGLLATFSGLSALTWQSISRVYTSFTGSFFDVGGTSTHISFWSASETTSIYFSGPLFTSTIIGSTHTITFPTVAGATSTNTVGFGGPLTSCVTISSSIATSSGLSATSSTLSTSGAQTTGTWTTNNSFPLTSCVTTITSTSNQNLTLNSTTGTTASTTLWSIGTGAPFVTSATATTTASTTHTTTATRPIFTTASTATPTWYGRISDVGTVLLVSNNQSRDDLAAWLQPTTGGVFGFEGFTFGTQTTLWPPGPVGTAGPIATSLSSAVTNVTSISVLWSSVFTSMSVGTFTTSTTETAASIFSDAENIYSYSSPLPLVTLSKTVTSFSTATTTVAGNLITPINTIFNVVSFASNQAYPPVTEQRTVVVSIPGSFATTISVLTYVPGYTTATIADGIGLQGGGIIQNISTSILTGVGLSLTTTTITAPWFYDTSCPTALASSTSTHSFSGSTTTLNFNTIGGVGTTITVTATSFGTNISGVTQFTHNLFATPSIVTPPAFGQASIASFRPRPTMQGFSPWTATSNTYQQLLAPPEVAALIFQPFETFAFGEYNSRGGPVTTTALGVWGISPQPVTTTTPATITVTTTNATTTMTTSAKATTLTQISCYTLSSATTAGSTSFTFSLQFPTNMDQAAANVYATTKSTSGTTSSSGSTSYSAALSVSNLQTAPFAETQGFTATSFGLTTVLTTATVVSQFGVGSSRTASVFTSTFLNFPVTFTLNTTSSGASTQNFPGVGGTAKYSGGGTVFCCGGAVSLYGHSSTSWSSANPNFFMVVIGGTATTSSSTTSNLGPGPFNVYSFPGEASLITGPCVSFTTDQNRLAPPASVGTAFWLTPDPLLIPNQVNALATSIK